MRTTLDLRGLSNERTRQIDEAVHTLVMLREFEMCRQYLRTDEGDTCVRCRGCDSAATAELLTTPHKKPIPPYSTSIEAAWLVRDAMKTRYPLLNLHITAYAYNRVYAQFAADRDEDAMSEANGVYCGPEAIVFAAFKACGIEVRE